MPPSRQVWLLILVVLSCWLGPQPAFAGPLDRFERLVMPGKLSKAHAKYESDCNNCHKPFKKGGQDDLCLACHKETNLDVKGKEGLHGRIPDLAQRTCSACHGEHKGRDADIVPFDRDTFDHARTDFPLRGTHANVSCDQCHNSTVKYRKATITCFGCHKKDDRHDEHLGHRCQDCHVETTWGEAFYNHEKTKFPLKAAHREVRCEACHINELYKDTPKGCLTCHKLDDVHKGDHREKCEACHTEETWSQITFDHNKKTKYSLEGKHAQITCFACHKGDVYKKINTTCITCHEPEDAHRGFFGKKCESCHVPKSWARNIFNHTKDTKYELKGRHKDVACIACHRGDVYAKLKLDCVACHQDDDVHQGEEGKKCQQCHDERGWDAKVFFDHDLTVFPLLGTHAITPCEECHLTRAFKEAEVKCRNCHLKDDERTHKKRLGLNCELCHNSNDWKKWFFDHDKQSKYPLTGAHKKLSCYGCHKTVVEAEIKLDKKCYSCHERDDRHLGVFGKDCERCHLTSSWKDLTLKK